MIDSSPIWLFNESTLAEASEFFYVSPGWAGVFSAFGLLARPVPVDPDKFWTVQRFCLMQAFVQSFRIPEDKPCGVASEPGSDYKTMIVAEGPVVKDGCEWSLTACDNVKTLSVPGLYRLVLNDPAALGQASAAVRFFPIDEFGGLT